MPLTKQTRRGKFKYARNQPSNTVTEQHNVSEQDTVSEELSDTGHCHPAPP